MERVENKKYFIDLINSSNANKFTAFYHYSGVGFKKAVINLGVFRKEDNLLVGVLQWGNSYQVGIRLDRYVKQPILKEEYLELNRFCMADSEGKNSESQAIGLGIKWIKKYRPNIKLLVSYSGRKEGNYGYIYQATNWEYIGYFISPGFWFVNGEERHQTTLWYRHVKHGNPSLEFKEDLCRMYSDVRQTWTKQFIYILRLDSSLETATEPLNFPKPATDFPIVTKEKIYKQDDTVYNSYKVKRTKPDDIYYSPEKFLFTKRTLQKRGELPLYERKFYAMYDIYGHLESTGESLNSFASEVYKTTGIFNSIKDERVYKNKFFKSFIETDIQNIPEEIEVPIVGFIDEIPFARLVDMANYLGISRQAVSKARQQKKKYIGKVPVIWV